MQQIFSLLQYKFVAIRLYHNPITLYDVTEKALGSSFELSGLEKF